MQAVGNLCIKIFFWEGGGEYKSHVQAKKSTFMLTTSQYHYFPERTMSFISKMTWKKKKILIFLINPLLGCAAMIWKNTSVSSLNIVSQQFRIDEASVKHTVQFKIEI